MICGDLDLERAQRDRNYRRLMHAFLVLKPRMRLTAIGFPELRRHDMAIHILSETTRRESQTTDTHVG